MRIEDLPQALQLQAYSQLATTKTPAQESEPVPITSEKALQTAVEALLRRLGWAYFHMPGQAARGNPIGWPDIIALGPAGKTLLIELKTAKGKLSPEQAHLFAKLHALDHSVHVCRSLSQVTKLIQGVQL